MFAMLKEKGTDVCSAVYCDSDIFPNPDNGDSVDIWETKSLRESIHQMIWWLSKELGHRMAWKWLLKLR